MCRCKEKPKTLERLRDRKAVEFQRVAAELAKQAREEAEDHRAKAQQRAGIALSYR